MLQSSLLVLLSPGFQCGPRLFRSEVVQHGSNAFRNVLVLEALDQPGGSQSNRRSSDDLNRQPARVLFVVS
jgi:hypothetical protein